MIQNDYFLHSWHKEKVGLTFIFTNGMFCIAALTITCKNILESRLGLDARLLRAKHTFNYMKDEIKYTFPGKKNRKTWTQCTNVTSAPMCASTNLTLIPWNGITGFNLNAYHLLTLNPLSFFFVKSTSYAETLWRVKGESDIKVLLFY